MNLNTLNVDEQHPLLPSGSWDGFYVYKKNNNKHKMVFLLKFKDGKISGSGNDDVGGFSFVGSYNLESMNCYLTKQYTTHSILYKGYIDENGIWGKWSHPYEPNAGLSEEKHNLLMSLLELDLTGGFHFWPSKGASNTNAAEQVKEVKKKVRKIVK